MVPMDPDVTVALANDQAKTHAVVNSLASVRSLAELLVDNPGLDPGDRNRFIAIIRDQTERLIHLMGQPDQEADALPSAGIKCIDGGPWQ